MKYLVILSLVVTLGSVLALPASHRASSDDVQETLHKISRKHGQFIFGLGYVSYYSPLWAAIKDLDDEELASFVEELHSHHKPQHEEEQAEPVEDEPVEPEDDEVPSQQQYGEVVPGLGFVSYYSPLWDVIKDLSDDELADFIKELYGYSFAQNQDKKAPRLRRHTTQEGENMAELSHIHHDSHYWSVARFFHTEEFRKFFSHLHLPHHRPLHRPVHHHHQEETQEAEEENEFPKVEPANFESPVEEVRYEVNGEANERKLAQNEDDENNDDSSNEITEINSRTQNEDQENNNAAEEEVDEKSRDQNEDEENAQEEEDNIEEENRGQNEAVNEGDVENSSIQNKDEEIAIEFDDFRAQTEDEENADEVEYKVDEAERQNGNVQDQENDEEVENEDDNANEDDENVEESEDEDTKGRAQH